MIAEGDRAPSFTATVGTPDHEPFEMTDYLEERPLVLAFFPGIFTPPCTNELTVLQDRLDAFDERDVTVFGISADSPFAQGAFREEYGLEFDPLSVMSRETMHEYNIEIDIPDLGLYEIANRSVFVVDESGQITFRWVASDPTNEPPYNELISALDELRSTSNEIHRLEI